MAQRQPIGTPKRILVVRRLARGVWVQEGEISAVNARTTFDAVIGRLRSDLEPIGPFLDTPMSASYAHGKYGWRRHSVVLRL